MLRFFELLVEDGDGRFGYIRLLRLSQGDALGQHVPGRADREYAEGNAMVVGEAPKTLAVLVTDERRVDDNRKTGAQDLFCAGFQAYVDSMPCLRRVPTIAA